MGRTTPSKGLQPPAQRKEARAKHARSIINKTIPAILSSSPRARKGVEAAELIVDPQASTLQTPSKKKNKKHNNANGTDQDQHGSPSPVISFQSGQTFTLSIFSTDALTAASHLDANKPPNSKKNVAILNMASPLRPGGGVLNGATSQEESLCLCTTLYASLKEEWYRLPETGAVWSPDVVVFKEGAGEGEMELGKRERWWVDVVSAGMLRFPDVDVGEQMAGSEDDDEDESDEGNRQAEGEVGKGGTGGRYSNETDRAMVDAKMTAVLRILAMKRIERVVLGAWGCGAYGNPVIEIARAWRRVLLGETKHNGKSTTSDSWAGLKEVVFAIKDEKMAEDFANAFGEELEVETLDLESDEDDEEDDAVGEDDELESKIHEMEVQIQAVRNPDLRKRLQSVLVGLKAQLDDRLRGRREVQGATVEIETGLNKLSLSTQEATPKEKVEKVEERGKRQSSGSLFDGDGFFEKKDDFFNDEFFGDSFLQKGAQRKTRPPSLGPPGLKGKRR